MPDTDLTDAERARLIRYRDALVRISNPGEDKAAALRSAEDMREIALKALRPDG